MVEKLQARTCAWKSKCFSWAGCATLIKSVAQVCPIYTMSSFKLPKNICKELDVVVRKFWWSPKEEKNKFFIPMAWKDLCRPCADGGMGFRKFESFNEATIAKLAWWVLSRRDGFCVRVLRAKYRVGNKWLSSNLARSASPSWRGIEGARTILKRGACKLVGAGDSILVWEDTWILGMPSFIPHPKNLNLDPQCLVVS